MALPLKYPHKFIVIEGIDGSGKTTVARLLSKRLGAKCFHTPPPGFAAIRRHIDSTAQVNSRFLFYLCSVTHASDSIRSVLPYRHVVCDRYIVSTVAHHRSLGLALNWRLDELKLLQPDFTFFLQIEDEAERRRRIASRDRTTAADIQLEDSGLRRRLSKEFAKYAMTRIDTSCLTVNEVVDKIRSCIWL